MAAPPRMLLLSGGGTEAFVLMPTTFDVSPSPSHMHLYKQGTIFYKWKIKADMVESPSCGTGEVPDS